MIEYTLPDVLGQRDELHSMHPDELEKMKQDIVHRMQSFVTAIDEALENIVESHCDICGKGDHAYTSIPKGWGWLKGGTLLCDGCIGRWTDRFGKEPEITREGELG